MRWIQVGLALVGAAFAAKQVSVPEWDGILLWVSGPFLLLAAAGAFLFRRDRSRGADVALFLTTVAFAVSTFPYATEALNETGRTTVFLLIPGVQFLVLLAYLPVWLVVRAFMFRQRPQRSSDVRA